MLLYEIVADLMPFVVALYLLECLAWTRPPGVLVAETLGGGFRLRERGVRFAGLLPWQRAYSAVDLPYLLDGAGLWVPLTRDLIPGRFYERANFARLRWDELPEVRIDHRRLNLGGTTVLYPSQAHAAAHALRLETLRRVDEERRTALVEEEGARALRLGVVSEIEERIRGLRRPLDGLCIGVFLLVFGALPATLMVGPLAPVLPWLLLLVFGLLVLVGSRVIRTARLLEGAGLRTDGILLPLVLSPPSLIRASVELAEHLLQGVEAVTVAVVLLDRRRATDAVRRALHAARYAVERMDACGADSGLFEAEQWRAVWQRRVALLERLAEQAGMAVEEVGRPPELEPGVGSYCPQCDGTFAAEVDCPTCAMPTLLVV